MPLTPVGAQPGFFVDAPVDSESEASCLLDRARGAASRVVFQDEECWGERSANQIPRGIDIVSETLVNQINQIESQLIRGNRQRAKTQQGNQRPGGDIVGELQPKTWPILLRKACCRASDVTTVGSGPYTHTFSGKVELDEGTTIEKRFGFREADDIVLQYLGSRVNQFFTSTPVEGILAARAGFISKQEVDVSEGADTLSALDDSIEKDQIAQFVTDNAPYNSFMITLEFDDEVLGVITTADFTLDNNMDPEGFALTGTPYRADISEGDRAMSGNMTCFFTPESYAMFYPKFKANTSFSIRWIMVRGDYSLEIFLPACTVGGQVTPTISGKGPLNLSLTYNAHTHEDSGNDIDVTVVNDEPTLTTAA